MFYNKKLFYSYFLCTSTIFFFQNGVIAQKETSLPPTIKKRPIFNKEAIDSSIKNIEKKENSLLGIFIERLWKRCRYKDSFKTEDNVHSWQWPARGKVLENFSKETKGLRLLVRENTPVYAMGPGVIAYTGSTLMDYGNMVIVFHKNNYASIYSHINTIAVKEGDKVAMDTVIGYVEQSNEDSFFPIYIALKGKKGFIDPKTFFVRPF